MSKHAWASSGGWLISFKTHNIYTLSNARARGSALLQNQKGKSRMRRLYIRALPFVEQDSGRMDIFTASQVLNECTSLPIFTQLSFILCILHAHFPQAYPSISA